MSAVLKFMYWSEQEINWNRADYFKVMFNSGGYVLVVDLTFIGFDINVKFIRVFIDNGSSIDILYRDTMFKFGITDNMFEFSRIIFYGIVPGVFCFSVDVLFGIRENCRIENLVFEVVDFNSLYYALFGRSVFVKFMVIIYICYFKMKMPGLNGIIIITGNYERLMECAAVGSVLVELLVIAGKKKL
ncbi:hypothetical protein EHS16_00005 [Streptococcus anginosus]|nr:hypothetical protein EHS16_00005 [Streptococcus anginosus]